MRQLKDVALCVCLLSGAAVAQDNVHLRGSDTLKDYTTALLADPGCTAGPLEGPLHYDGGGSGTGISRLIQARTPPAGEVSQRVAPASRAVSGAEIAQALGNNLDFVDHVLALDAVVILVNDAGNPALTKMLFSTARKIWTCDPSIASWGDVPGSDRTDAIDVNARDEASGTTDNFTSRIGGFTTTGDRWWDNYPCVTVCRPGPGDDCTDFLGTYVAAIDNAIAFTGLPGLRTGNRDLALCNDTNNPPHPCVADSDYTFQSQATIRAETYPLSRRLHYYSVKEHSGPAFGPEGSQLNWLNCALTPAVSCPLLQAQDFISDGTLCTF